jgi:predicted transcriptional regulator
MVLNLLEEENLSCFSFTGLKRRSGLHQETLSRILCRLEDQGMIKKGLNGYKLILKGKVLSEKSVSFKEPHNISILKTRLPSNIKVDEIVSELKYKWFGILRWMGYSKKKNNITLKWITDDCGIQVDAVFTSRYLLIRAKPLNNINHDLAMFAAYQIMSYIIKIYTRLGRISEVDYFTFTTEKLAV